MFIMADAVFKERVHFTVSAAVNVVRETKLTFQGGL